MGRLGGVWRRRRQARSLRDGAEAPARERLPAHSIDACTALTGFNESWWLGLSALHTLFAREHNVVCDELRAPTGLGRRPRLQTARLIVSALIAKIHTVEWTPAILATQADRLRPQGHLERAALQRLADQTRHLADRCACRRWHPGTTPDHHGVPFSLTEDFVTVYRMHPLIPDDYRFSDHTDRREARPADSSTSRAQADDELRSIGLDNAMYSFGIAHPGAITLNNYPRRFRASTREDEPHRPLGGRHRAHTPPRRPRYNDFRAGLHKPRAQDIGND